MAAAASVGSSFSTSVQTLKCLRAKTSPSDPFLKMPSTRVLQLGLTSQSMAIESLAVSQSWRVGRILASVVQEEAAAAATAEDMAAPVEDEAAPVEEVEEEKLELSPGEGETTSATVTTKLYFGNLPYHCDSAQLAGIIQDYASPELVEVLYNRDTGRSRGFAFVTMSSIKDCDAVIQNLDGSEFGGRTLRVNFSDKPKPRDPLYPETEYKLFVGNLAWSVTSEGLTEAFQEYGNVVGARVLYDGETGRSRGYGFVCYSTKPEMETALEAMNGVELEGRAMRVSLAQGKRQ